MCFSNTRFTSLQVYELKIVSLQPQPETVPAPVSYRSSRRRRQRKRLFLKVSIVFALKPLNFDHIWSCSGKFEFL